MGILGKNVMFGFGDVLIYGELQAPKKATKATDIELKLSMFQSVSAMDNLDHMKANFQADEGVDPVNLYVNLTAAETLHSMLGQYIAVARSVREERR